MSAVSYYVSASVPSSANQAYAAANSASAGKINMGTSSYASDPFELRITTGATNGPTSITKLNVETFLELVKRWLHDQDSGLDYVISATQTGTYPGVP